MLASNFKFLHFHTVQYLATVSDRIIPAGVLNVQWQEDCFVPKSSMNVSIRINGLMNSTVENRTLNTGRLATHRQLNKYVLHEDKIQNIPMWN
jgi:hypothetical protein